MTADKKTFTLLKYICCFLFFNAGFSVFAQSQDWSILLKNNTITPPANASQWAGQRKAEAPRQVLVQFYGIPDALQKTILEENGIQLISYIPQNTFVSILYGSVSKEVIAATGIRSILDMQPEWKKDERLNAHMKGAEGDIDIQVSFHNAGDEANIRAAVATYEARIIKDGLKAFGIYTLRLPIGKLNDLAGWYGVAYISPASEDVPLNFESKTATRGTVASFPAWYGGYGLTGNGVVVGIGDNVSAMTHVDLKDRIINYNPQPYTNHGVHINGITGGAGIVNPKGEGMAPKATLINHYYSQVWEQTTAMYEAHGMTVTNNSYAANVGDCRAAGVYDVGSVAIDEVSLKHKDVLHVFAAGNDGKMKCSPYPDGYATVTGSYQPAKNNIVVTSTDKFFVNAVDGSRGPVKDGRLKPEITAVGVDVNSTTRVEEYLVAGGTSMASPAVAGGIALLSERYRQVRGPVNPRAEVLKVLMLNGATDIGNPGPDYRFGFGFMNMQRSLNMLDAGRYLMDNVGNGGTKELNIAVPAGMAKLKVMLTWHDAPGNPVSAVQLVNDLDLEVVGTAGGHKPLVLDATPANILKDATEQEDHLNNTEQVVINTPAAGNYTIRVKGYKIPSGIQEYALAYDMVPAGISIAYPDSGAQVKAADRLIIYWNADEKNNRFALEFTTDGSNWKNIADNIAADTHHYVWNVPDTINSNNCRIRLTRKNTAEVAVSRAFTINKQPVAKLSASQCPSYFNMEWGSIPGATGYEVSIKKGAQLVPADTVSDTTYSFSGLSPDSFYYASVRPFFNGVPGYRSLAIKRQPKDGNCANPSSDGDLMLESLISPKSGRKHTSTELKPGDNITFLIRNLDNVPTNYYQLSYSINNGPWVSEISNTPIPENSHWQLAITGLDFSATGNYTVRAAVTNLLMEDPQHGNDTITRFFRQLPNEPMDLASPFADGFESPDIVSVNYDSMGFTPNGHWDYVNASDTGRLRTWVNRNITISGMRSVSMDAYKHVVTGSRNTLVGTFNLSRYDATKDEVRLDFNYILHGQISQSEGNDVWIRSSDTSQWQRMGTYSVTNQTVGKVQQSGSISLSDAILRGNGWFSPSTQIRFEQNEVSVIGNRDFGKGLTLDDIRLYTVQNDMQLLRVVSPATISCGLPAEAPLTIQLYNSMATEQTNVQVFYRIDSGAIVSETIPSIKGKQTITYSFRTPMRIPVYTTYKLDIWLAAAGDTYLGNDSILNYSFRNQPQIKQYPYKEDFENSDGGWYADGVKNSWEYGTPASEKIKGAASGSKAWKTNLDGKYSDGETSYLNGPCFDLSDIDSPVLRFKIAMDIENCGIVYCDAAYMEYSVDGRTWTRLGASGMGMNWYNDTLYDVWSQQDVTNWHEASIPLPRIKTSIRLRYVFTSDPGGNFEGIAIDDVEVIDRKYRVPAPGLIRVSPNPNSTGNLKITWEAYTGTAMDISIRDMMGREVYTTSIQANGTYNETTIQTPVFQSGMYFLHARIGDRKFVEKIVYRKD